MTALFATNFNLSQGRHVISCYCIGDDTQRMLTAMSRTPILTFSSLLGESAIVLFKGQLTPMRRVSREQARRQLRADDWQVFVYSDGSLKEGFMLPRIVKQSFRSLSN
ncbi:MAG TPA: hypothetical protein DCE56_29700 [Cyanobacteria bacterium UBA8553]|nr:hypothetical protein [Cyanobacteria bacterium UBA8553]